VVLVIDCQPDEQQAFIDELFQFIDAYMKTQPGFVSAAVYGSEDGTKIVEHFQWTERAAYETYRQTDIGQQAVDWLLKRRPQLMYLQLNRTVEGV